MSKPCTREAVRAVLRDDGPATYAQIAQAIGKTVDAVRHAIKAARAINPSFAHISDWERNLGLGHGGKMSPVWRLGKGRDKPMPEPLDRHRRFREKHGARRRLQQRVRKPGVTLCPMAHMAAALGARVG